MCVVVCELIQLNYRQRKLSGTHEYHATGYSYNYRVAHMSTMPLVIAIVIEWHT